MNPQPIQIGCELIVRRGDRILLGLRKNVYGAGTWALPGGHLEFGERLADAACREAEEELNADVSPNQLKLISITDDLQTDHNKHYVHVTFELRDPTWEPFVAEPERCEKWQYFPLDALPENFFLPHVGIMQNYQASRQYDY